VGDAGATDTRRISLTVLIECDSNGGKSYYRRGVKGDDDEAMAAIWDGRYTSKGCCWNFLSRAQSGFTRLIAKVRQAPINQASKRKGIKNGSRPDTFVGVIGCLDGMMHRDARPELSDTPISHLTSSTSSHGDALISFRESLIGERFDRRFLVPPCLHPAGASHWRAAANRVHGPRKKSWPS
jgi:hypothetical protein